MAYDPTLDVIGDLDQDAAIRAYWMVWAVRSAGAPLIVTSGLRSASEQAKLVAAGRSKTLSSKHLTGRAFDVDISGMNRNDVPTEFWNMLGPWAEQQLGLVWGGRWKSIYDPGHFELPS